MTIKRKNRLIARHERTIAGLCTIPAIVATPTLVAISFNTSLTNNQSLCESGLIVNEQAIAIESKNASYSTEVRQHHDPRQ